MDKLLVPGLVFLVRVGELQAWLYNSSMKNMSINRVALALGSNLGDRKAFFDFALKRLAEEGLKELKCAEVLESEPMDCPEGSSTYLNTALTGEWSGSAQELLQVCLKIEHEAGRRRTGLINESRFLDIDVLLFEDETYKLSDLIVPHPRMCERDFVLGPLAELAPNWSIPGKNKTVKQCLEELR